MPNPIHENYPAYPVLPSVPQRDQSTNLIPGNKLGYYPKKRLRNNSEKIENTHLQGKIQPDLFQPQQPINYGYQPPINTTQQQYYPSNPNIYPSQNSHTNQDQFTVSPSYGIQSEYHNTPTFNNQPNPLHYNVQHQQWQNQQQAQNTDYSEFFYQQRPNQQQNVQFNTVQPASEYKTMPQYQYQPQQQNWQSYDQTGFSQNMESTPTQQMPQQQGWINQNHFNQ